MVYAINIGDPTVNPVAKFGSLATIINVIVPLLTTIAAIIFLVMLLRGAYLYLTAGSTPDNIKKAQKTFTYAIAGLILVLVSYILVKLIGVVFNLGNTIPL